MNPSRHPIPEQSEPVNHADDKKGRPSPVQRSSSFTLMYTALLVEPERVTDVVERRSTPNLIPNVLYTSVKLDDL
jgi:hypothetical protein